MNETLLKLTNIHSGYGDIEVLRDVSMEIPRSKVTTVIGPNGAGKSTLLKTIFGLLRPTRGRIILGDDDVTGFKPAELLRRGISYVPQGRSSIFPLMTVRENLEMGAYVRRDPQIQEDIEKIMEKFPILLERKKQLAGNLSGGEQQILAIAMSLLLSPRLLLLDEPSLGLSPKNQDVIFEEIQRINGQGTTILMVEQNATRALEISDYGVVLALGQKRFEGTGREILESEEVRRLYIRGR